MSKTKKNINILLLFMVVALIIGLGACVKKINDVKKPSGSSDVKPGITDGNGNVPSTSANNNSGTNPLNNEVDLFPKGSSTIKLNTDVKSLFFNKRILDLEPIGADVFGTNSIRFNKATGKYEFVYKNGSTKILYTIDTTSNDVKNGLLNVDATLNDYTTIHAVTDGGTKYRTSTLKQLEPKDLAEQAVVKFAHKPVKNGVRFDYTETYDGVTSQKSYYFTIKNMSLVIEANSDSKRYKNGYSGFTTGKATGIKDARYQASVFAEDIPAIVVENKYFLSAYIDKALTNATSKSAINYAYPGSGDAQTGVVTKYERNSANETNTLGERAYITVSEKMMDCIYLTSATKSIYRDSLTEKVVFEEWLQGQNTFSARLSKYSRLAETYHMDKIYFIDHPWQRDGYDTSLPATTPANPSLGTDSELRNYVATMRGKYGWQVALHEDYWFMDPTKTNQYFKEVNVKNRLVQDAFGGLFTCYANAYAIKPSEMMYYSNIESNKIKNAYKPNGIFMDVNGAWYPDFINQVTFDAKSKTSRSLSMSIAENIKMFNNMKNIYNSPFVSEGCAETVESFSSGYAGFVEAVEREIVGNTQANIMPDYELNYIRPLMANQGMGYHTRFQPTAPSVDGFDFDKYNTMAIAYGHTGSISDMLMNIQDEQYVNTYYMFQAIQSQYLDTKVSVKSITYYDGTNKMDLNEAVLNKYNFRKARLHIVYSNGLEIYLNFSVDNWSVMLNGNSYILDPNGYVAENKSINFIQYSCLKNGHRVDYVNCKDYIYANGRGIETNFGNGIVTNSFSICRKDVKDSGTLSIYSLSAEDVIKVGATIGFDTSKPARVKLLYSEGVTEPKTIIYGMNTFQKTHTINIMSGLKAGTTYSYKVVGEDLYGHIVSSAVKTFKTSGNPGDELPHLLVPVLNTSYKYTDLFSDINGDNNLYYYYLSDEGYKQLDYSYVSGYYKHPSEFPIISPAFTHAGTRDAAVGFKSPVQGTLEIQYSIKYNGVSNDCDGIFYEISKNADNILPSVLLSKNKPSLTGTKTINVNKDDFIYFNYNKNINNYSDHLTVEYTFKYTSIK